MGGAAKDNSKRSPMLDWTADLTLRLCIYCLLKLPLRWRLGLMSWLFRKVLAGRSGYRARALANLSHVWPDLQTDQAEQIAEDALDNAARTIIENYDVQTLRARMADVTPEGPGVVLFEAAQAAGQPVLLVTGHFGNFEAARACLVARGAQIGGLYRPMANPYFNAHYAQNMHALSGPVFEQGTRGTIGLLRHVKQGGIAVLLFDLYDSAGIPLPFLGQPAPTLTSAAEIALKTGAIMMPFFAVRQQDGVGFRVILETPIAPSDPETMMREMTKRLENRIADNPGQWFWIHRRWKPKRQRKRAEKAAKAQQGA